MLSGKNVFDPLKLTDDEKITFINLIEACAQNNKIYHFKPGRIYRVKPEDAGFIITGQSSVLYSPKRLQNPHQLEIITDKIGEGGGGAVLKTVTLKRQDQQVKTHEKHVVKLPHVREDVDCFERGFVGSYMRAEEKMKFQRSETLACELIPDLRARMVTFHVSRIVADEYEWKAVLMRKLEGKQLADWMMEHEKDNSITNSRLIIALNLIYAVQRVHDFKLLHRDIKLDNAFVTDALDVTVIDYDTCCPVSKPDSRYCGTKLFLPPEVDTKKLYGIYTDVFSLGLALAELFGVDDEPEKIRTLSDLERRFKYLFSNAQDLNEKHQNEIRAILMRMCQMKLEDRCQLIDVTKVFETIIFERSLERFRTKYQKDSFLKAHQSAMNLRMALSAAADSITRMNILIDRIRADMHLLRHANEAVIQHYVLMSRIKSLRECKRAIDVSNRVQGIYDAYRAASEIFFQLYSEFTQYVNQADRTHLSSEMKEYQETIGYFVNHKMPMYSKSIDDNIVLTEKMRKQIEFLKKYMNELRPSKAENASRKNQLTIWSTDIGGNPEKIMRSDERLSASCKGST